jgi:hypothetical protein
MYKKNKLGRSTPKKQEAQDGFAVPISNFLIELGLRGQYPMLLSFLNWCRVNLALFPSRFRRRIPVPNHADYSQKHAKGDMEIEALFAKEKEPQGQHENRLHVA